MLQEGSEKLVCPACGNDGSDGRIRYVETIECYRSVLGMKDGQLRVESHYASGEGYDEGRDPYFECRGSEVPGGFCGHRWPVPPAVEEAIDWVWEPPPPNAPLAPAEGSAPLEPTPRDAPPAPAEAPVLAEPKLQAITCPKCAVSLASGAVHLIERIESDRHVLGVAEGQLRVSSLYDTNADDGGGEDPHFECHNRLSDTHWCDERWPVPAWVRSRITWV